MPDFGGEISNFRDPIGFYRDKIANSGSDSEVLLHKMTRSCRLARNFDQNVSFFGLGGALGATFGRILRGTPPKRGGP